MGLQYIKKYLLKGTQEKIPDTMVETVLCFHPHCTTKRRGVKPEEKLCSKPVSPAEIGTYGKKIKAISYKLNILLRFESLRHASILHYWCGQLIHNCRFSGAGSLRPIIFYRRLSGSVFFFLLFQEVHEGYFYLPCPVLFLLQKGFL